MKIKFFTPFFYLLPDFRNIGTKVIVLTCSRPLFIQISNLKLICDKKYYINFGGEDNIAKLQVDEYVIQASLL